MPINQALPRTRTIHIHGCRDATDHQSLDVQAEDTLDPVLAALLQAEFNGVLTLEVFGQSDFWTSLQALRSALNRLHPEIPRIPCTV